jgi:hypothetical protein
MNENKLNEEENVRHWPKPKPSSEWSEPDENGHRYSTIDLTPHPSILMHWTRARATDWEVSFRDEAVRFYQIMNTADVSVDWARKLARRTHILHIDEDSSEEHYVLSLREVKEEEE